MVKLDVKDVYLTVPVWINYVASAPKDFTKIMKSVVDMLRKMGVGLTVYLDYILIIAESKQLATQHSQLVSTTLENLGFVVNYEKSVLTPSPQMEYLGFLVDSTTMSLALPREKIRKIQRWCQKAFTVSSQCLDTSKVGKLRFAKQFIQAVFAAPLHYRHLLNLKNRQLCHSIN